MYAQNYRVEQKVHLAVLKKQVALSVNEKGGLAA